MLVAPQVLYEPGDAIPYIHFPTDAFVSMVATEDERKGLLIGMIGNEGALGCELVLDNGIAPLRMRVQGTGMAWRLSAGSLRQEMAHSTALRHLLHRYLYVLLVQSGRAGACNRFHMIEARLARWLLTTQDCAHSDTLMLTHDLLAHLLGVRRAGITNAASALHRRHLISYRRGVVTIANRAGLEEAACTCYRAGTCAYDALRLAMLTRTAP